MPLTSWTDDDYGKRQDKTKETNKKTLQGLARWQDGSQGGTNNTRWLISLLFCNSHKSVIRKVQHLAIGFYICFHLLLDEVSQETIMLEERREGCCNWDAVQV